MRIRIHAFVLHFLWRGWFMQISLELFSTVGTIHGESLIFTLYWLTYTGTSWHSHLQHSPPARSPPSALSFNTRTHVLRQLMKVWGTFSLRQVPCFWKKVLPYDRCGLTKMSSACYVPFVDPDRSHRVLFICDLDSNPGTIKSSKPGFRIRIRIDQH